MKTLESSLNSKYLVTPKKSKVSSTLSLAQVLKSYDFTSAGQKLPTDLETINWVLSHTEVSVIESTIHELDVNTLLGLLRILVAKLRVKVEKKSLLWLSAILKFRWMNILSLQSDPVFRELMNVFTVKSDNLVRYFELKAKLDMVIQCGSVTIDKDSLKLIEPLKEQKHEDSDSDDSMEADEEI